VALAVLLSINMDEAKGRIGSRRTYERLGCSGRLVTRLLAEYEASRHELEPAPKPTPRRARGARSPDQREMPLLTQVVGRSGPPKNFAQREVGGKPYHQKRTRNDTTFCEGIRMVGEKTDQQRHQNRTTSESLRVTDKSEPARAPGHYRRVRAARAEARRRGQLFPDLAALEARAAELTDEQVDTLLAEAS